MSTSPFLEGTLLLPAPAEARWVWAVVTQASPLRIRLDGDRVALGITPDDLSGGLRTVGDRVYCQILNRRLVVFGPTIPFVPTAGIGTYLTNQRATGFTGTVSTDIALTAEGISVPAGIWLIQAGAGIATTDVPDIVSCGINVGATTSALSGSTGVPVSTTGVSGAAVSATSRLVVVVVATTTLYSTLARRNGSSTLQLVSGSSGPSAWISAARVA